MRALLSALPVVPLVVVGAALGFAACSLGLDESLIGAGDAGEGGQQQDSPPPPSDGVAPESGADSPSPPPAGVTCTKDSDCTLSGACIASAHCDPATHVCLYGV